MDIHQKLWQLLQERGWTEYRLSKECGLSQSTLTNIFHRGTSPSIKDSVRGLAAVNAPAEGGRAHRGAGVWLQ